MLFYDSPHNCIGHIWRASLTRVLPCVSSKCPSRLLTNYNCCICETFSITFVKYHSLVLILYVSVQITFPTCFKVTIFTCESQITFSGHRRPRSIPTFLKRSCHCSMVHGTTRRLVIRGSRPCGAAGEHRGTPRSQLW